MHQHYKLKTIWPQKSSQIKFCFCCSPFFYQFFTYSKILDRWKICHLTSGGGLICLTRDWWEDIILWKIRCIHKRITDYEKKSQDIVKKGGNGTREDHLLSGKWENDRAYPWWDPVTARQVRTRSSLNRTTGIASHPAGWRRLHRAGSHRPNLLLPGYRYTRRRDIRRFPWPLPCLPYVIYIMCSNKKFWDTAYVVRSSMSPGQGICPSAISSR